MQRAHARTTGINPVFAVFFFAFLAALSIPSAWAEDYSGGPLVDGGVYDKFTVKENTEIQVGQTITVNGDISVYVDRVLDVHGTLKITEDPKSPREIEGTVEIRPGGSLVVDCPPTSWQLSVVPTGGKPGREDAILRIHDGASATLPGGIYVGSAARVYANGNLAARDVSIQGGGIYEEGSTVTIDAVGGTPTTRDFITTYPSYIYGGRPGQEVYWDPGTYKGNVIIDHPLSEDYRLDGGLVIGGLHIGNVELRRGLVDFWRGGTLEGNLTSSGGVVLVEESPDLFEEPERHPTTIYGDIKIRNGSFVIDPNLNLTLQQGISFDGGSLEAAQASLSGSGDISITNGARAEVDAIKGFNDRLSIGSAADTVGGASLSAGTVELGQSGRLLLDPAWGLAPARAAIEKLSAADDSALQGKVGVGMNSQLALGTRDLAWLDKVVSDSTGGAGLSQNGTQSALALYKPLKIASGGALRVDGSQTSAELERSLEQTTPKTAVFATKSLLALNGQDPQMKNGDPAISFEGDKGTVEVHEGAQIFISQAQPGVLYRVADTYVNEIAYYSEDGSTRLEPSQATAWEGENLRASSDMIKLTWIHRPREDAGEGNETPGAGPDAPGIEDVIVAEGNDAADVFPDLSPEIAEVETDIYAGTPGKVFADPFSVYPGVRFLSRATDNEWNGGISRRESASTVESAARMAVLGAVPQMARLAGEAGSAAVSSRLGPANLGIQLEEYEKGPALWIMPLYRSGNGFGLEAGSFGHDWNGALGGLALGGDWTFSESLRAGLSFNIGGGYAKSHGDLLSTENRVSFWGLEAYAGWRPNDFGLIADFGFTSTYNKLKQELPAFMGMEDLKSDIQAMLLHAGLRAEYAFHAGPLDITPHAGVNYNYFYADSHDIKSGGRSVIEADSFSQNFWTFPVGVSLSADIGLDSGWSLRPSLDLEVVPLAGDAKVKTKTRFTGTDRKIDLRTQIYDQVTYGGTAGLEIGKENLSFSVAYTGQFGPHTSANGAFAAFRYEF